jgi:hypothetical protein
MDHKLQARKKQRSSPKNRASCGLILQTKPGVAVFSAPGIPGLKVRTTNDGVYLGTLQVAVAVLAFPATSDALAVIV